MAKGGEWELVKSASGCSGEISVTGSDVKLGQSCGESFGSLVPMSGASDFLLSGYLSQIPSLSLTPMVLQFTSSGGITAAGQTFVLGTAEPVKLYFNTEMASTTFPVGLRVNAVIDSLGNLISSSQTLTLAYSAAEQLLLVSKPAAGWPKGTTYDLIVSSDILDINGLRLVSSGTYAFTTLRDHLAENVPVARGQPGVRVEIPANAFGSDFFLTLSTGVENGAVASANSKMLASGAERRPVIVAQADPYNASGGPWSGALSRNVELALPYPDLDDDGLVDQTSPPLRAKTLSMWRLDENQALWVRQAGGTLDPAIGALRLSTSHFSIYALIGALDTEVSEVYAYPVPFRPNVGNPARYGCWSGCANNGITFTNLPSEGTIRIYTISGRLVREMNIASNPQSWDVANSAGQVVASGLYLWEVRSGHNRKTGKLIVIK